MARLLHLLSKYSKVQDKLRKELVEARRQKEGQDLSYDEIVVLPYLDAVCRETLRLSVVCLVLNFEAYVLSEDMLRSPM